MTDILISQLKDSANARSDDDAMLMVYAAEELERQRLQINSLLRAVDLLSEDVLQRCSKIEAILIRHLGDVP
jgi:hypothetical protein